MSKRRLALVGISLAAVAAAVLAALFVGRSSAHVAYPAVHPASSDIKLISTGTTPPTEAQCNSVGRTCFTPASTRSAYNLQPIYDSGITGRGMTIAIVDSYGSDTMRHDLRVYNDAFGLPHMCGEEGITCQPGMPTYSELHLNGSPATK